MKPITIQYGENKTRNYEVLKPGIWTNIIFEEMYKKFKLLCCFVFKRCKIYLTFDNIILKIFAKCKDKNCQKKKKRPLEDEPLKIKLIIPYSENIDHACKCKMHLSGEKRMITGKELQNTESYLWQKEQVNTTIAFGEKFLRIFIQLKC